MNDMRREFVAADTTRGMPGWWTSLSLAGQCALLSLAAAAAVAGLVQVLRHLGLGAAAGPDSLPWVLATVAALGGAVVTAWAWRVDRSLRDFSGQAQDLRQGVVTDERNLSLIGWSASLRRMSGSMRHLIAILRRQLRQLVAANAALGQELRSRSHELNTLEDLSIGLAQRGDIYGLIDEALGALEQTMVYTTASVWGRVGLSPREPVVLLGYRSGMDDPTVQAETLRGMRLSRQHLEHYEQIERDRQPVVENRVHQSLLSWLWSRLVDDARTSALYRDTRSWTAVPLTAQEMVLGVMRVDHDQPDHFNAERVRLLQAVASQTALAIRHAQLKEHEREVAVVAERSRIARDLHDAVSQTLFAANVVAGTLAQTARRAADDPMAREVLSDQSITLERLNRGALSEMRLLMFELRPDAMEQAPLRDLLVHAIEALRSRADLEVAQDLQGDGELPPAERIQVYRMAQEAFSNIARHSAARHVTVRWRSRPDGSMQLRITDDGRGFDPDASFPGHFGLENMRSRAAELAAVLTLTSDPGLGTMLSLERGEWSDDE